MIHISRTEARQCQNTLNRMSKSTVYDNKYIHAPSTVQNTAHFHYGKHKIAANIVGFHIQFSIYLSQTSLIFKVEVSVNTRYTMNLESL